MANNRKTLAISIAFIGLFLLGIIGFTYAFFIAGVIGNETVNDTVIETADLRLLFNDTQILKIENALPGSSTTKTFTVTNIGNVKLYYDINIIDVTNSFVNNELVYSLTSTNGGATATNIPLPTSNLDLITDVEITPGVTQVYTMTVKFIERGENQNINQGAIFSGKLQINASRLISDEIEFGIEETMGDVVINQSRSINLIGAYYGNVTCESADENIAQCIPDKNKININGKNLGTTEITVKESIKNLEVNYTVTVKEPSIYSKILSDNTAISDSSIDFTQLSSETNGKGLYYTENNATYGEDGQKIYYYRGVVNNNWVSFGGFLWRIVRTTSEGEVKLLYSGDGNTTSAYIGTTVFNTGYNSKYHGGYTYNTDLNGYTGAQTDSAVKTAIDDWYNTNLNTFSNYLSETAIYCADRSSERTDGTNIYYAAYDRLWTAQRPTFACPSENASRYTVSTSTGNGYLQKPVALLSADEMYYAGNTLNAFNDFTFIRENATENSWWSMTPYYLSKGSMRVLLINGKIEYYNTNSTNIGARPSVSLKSCVTVTDGNGTKSTPYTVSNTSC